MGIGKAWRLISYMENGTSDWEDIKLVSGRKINKYLTNYFKNESIFKESYTEKDGY